MALVPFPPTSAAFIAACSKPEAFIGGTGASGIALATIEQVLREEADRAAEVALSDRATFPLLEISEGFQAAIFGCTGRRLMAFRGYNKGAGADDELVELAKRGDEYLAACGPGSGGKRITPRYTDSKQNTVIDGIRIMSNRSADGWARSGSDPRGPSR